MTRSCAFVVAIACSACGRTSPPSNVKPRIVVALTVDWEGAAIDPEGLEAIELARAKLGDAPITHFVCPAYFAKATIDPMLVPALRRTVRPGDELAVHLHGWRSLATAAGIAAKLSPSYLTGTDQLLEFEDGDVGFDVDLDAYDVEELRALLRTARRLLEPTKLPIAHTFRAGGYLGTPKVLEAAFDEGYTIDSSAIDYRQLGEVNAEFFSQRLEQLWGELAPGAGPALRGEVFEMPISAVADYATTAEIAEAISAAHQRLHAAPDKDQFVVIAFHQETASEMVSRIVDALADLRANRELDEELLFTTIDGAADLART